MDGPHAKSGCDNRILLLLPPTSKSIATGGGGARIAAGRNVEDAERFIDRVGFAACLTDARRPGRRSMWRSADGATQ